MSYTGWGVPIKFSEYSIPALAMVQKSLEFAPEQIFGWECLHTPCKHAYMEIYIPPPESCIRTLHVVRYDNTHASVTLHINLCVGGYVQCR